MAVIRFKGKRNPNPLLAGASGKIGDNMIVKQYKYGMVISGMPHRNPRKKPSAAQEARRLRFHEAVLYAKQVINDPKKKAALEKKLKGKRTAFQFAISEYLKKAKGLAPNARYPFMKPPSRRSAKG